MNSTETIEKDPDLNYGKKELSAIELATAVEDARSTYIRTSKEDPKKQEVLLEWKELSTKQIINARTFRTAFIAQLNAPPSSPESLQAMIKLLSLCPRIQEVCEIRECATNIMEDSLVMAKIKSFRKKK